MNRDLWILAGQSNMEGIGLLDGPLEPPHDDVRVFAHGDRWELASEPLHWLLESRDPVHAELMGIAPAALADAQRAARADRPRGAGLGLAFARRVADEAGVAVDLLPVAHRSTSLGDWDPARAGECGRSLYGAMLRRVHAALASSTETRLAGVLWYQGEDECSPEGAAEYTDRMIELITALRRDLSRDDLPFYLVQLGRYAMPEPEPHSDDSWSRIREAQRLLPGEIGRTAVVPAIDLELGDTIHIGTQGLRRLGRRLASVALADTYGAQTSRGIRLDHIESDGDLIRVSFAGVVDGLRAPDPAGRVPGFAIADAAGAPEPRRIFSARVSAPDTIELALGSPSGVRVSYGWGLSPFCQLIDDADMAVPAFGPLSAERP